MKKKTEKGRKRRRRAAAAAVLFSLLLAVSSISGTWNAFAGRAWAAETGASGPAGDSDEDTAARPPAETAEGQKDSPAKSGEENRENGSPEGSTGEAGSGQAGSGQTGESSIGKTGESSIGKTEEGEKAGEGGTDDTSANPGEADRDPGEAGQGSASGGQDHAEADRTEEAVPTEDRSGEGGGNVPGSAASDTSNARTGAKDPADTAGRENGSKTSPGTASPGNGDNGSRETGETVSQAPAEGVTGVPAAVIPDVEETWMTGSEFNRAFEKVTSGAANAGTATLSKAMIISKENEIDYEELGIGKDAGGHPGHTTPINIRDEDGNDYQGICVVPDDRGWAKWTVLPKVTRVTDGVMIRLYYYTMLDGYGESLAKSKGFGSNSKKVAIAACHEAMAMRYAELAGISYDRPNVGSNLKSLISAYRSGVASKPLPDADRVFVYISGRTQSEGNWMQAYVFGRIREDEPSSIVLTKESSDMDMRNAFSTWYCLHETDNGGTVNFRMYTDKACTKPVKVYGDPNMTAVIDPIPVGLSGKSGLWNQAVFYCPPGTYYLKELTTPRGYQTQKEPFGPYTFQEGKGKNIKVTNTPKYARAGIIKKDAETGELLSGAEFGLYADKEDARNAVNPQAIFKIGSDGKSNTLEVLAGKNYYVREIKAPAGHKLIPTIRGLKVAESFSSIAWTEITNEKEYGTVQVKKAPEDPEIKTGAGSPYSLEGAEYTLYDADGKSAGTLTTGQDGSSNILRVPAGEYTLKETKPSAGFEIETEVHKVTVKEEKPAVIESKEPEKKGRITVRKVSSLEKEEKAGDTPALTGAVYGLYKSEDDAREEGAAAGTFVIREDGSSNVVEVPAGTTWYIKETKAPEGYLPDRRIHEVRVESLTETVTVESQDRLIFGGLKVCKRDLETGGSRAVGGATLKGAVLTVYNDSRHSVYAEDRKVLPGKAVMTLTTDEKGTAQTSERALSYGSYRIEETSAPEGYTKEGAEPVRFSIEKDGYVVDLTGKAETSVRDRVIRSDFSLSKINGYSKKRMEGVTFEVTALDREGKAIESHRFTTGRDGSFVSTDAWAAEAAADRIWFGSDTLPDKQLGALPFGAYRIREIEGENNRGMKMYTGSFSVDKDGQILDLGTIENTLRPVIETELVDADGDHYADQRGEVTLTDTVTYQGMEDYIGKEVTFHGVIYVKETGEPLRIDGKTIECVETRRIAAHSGTVQLRFTFDGSKAQGMTLVCYEYVSEAYKEQTDPGTGSPSEGGTYHDSTNGGKDICAHTDLKDEAQTVHLVSVETEAKDLPTGMHIGEARDGAVTVDHVTCRGLIPGTAYRVTGFLVDKADGKPLVDADGREVTAEASFTAKASEEAVDLTFTYDASLIEGTTVVAFEQLYLGGGTEPGGKDPTDPADPEGPTEPGPDKPGEEGPDPEKPIAVHEDPDDEDQSVHYPQIRTFASASDGEAKTITADGRITVHDHVTWKNLLPGRVYRLHGTLMRRDTGEAFKIDGKPVEAQASFTAETKDGEQDLDFTFDAGNLFDSKESAAGNEGKAEESLSIVAFEELYVTGADSSAEHPAGEEPSGEKPGEDGTPGQEPSPGDPSSEDPSSGKPSSEDPSADTPGDTEEDGYLVASHKDPEDPAQTVLLRKPEQPEKPDQPEEPDQPDQPTAPDKPSKTAEPEKKETRKKVTPASPETIRTARAPRTGDDTNVVLYLVPALGAAAVIAGILILKKKKKQ